MNLKPPAPALIRCTFGSLDGVGCDDADDVAGLPTMLVITLSICATAGEASSWLAAIASLAVDVSLILRDYVSAWQIQISKYLRVPFLVVGLISKTNRIRLALLAVSSKAIYFQKS